MAYTSLMKNKLTKKEAAARKAEWTKALTEGRVIRFGNGDSFRSFPTIEARDEFLAKLEPGLAEVVKL